MKAMARQHSHSVEFKRQVAQEFIAGESLYALSKRHDCMSSEHFGQLAWQFKRMSGSSGLKVQAAMAC